MTASNFAAPPHSLQRFLFDSLFPIIYSEWSHLSHTTLSLASQFPLKFSPNSLIWESWVPAIWEPKTSNLVIYYLKKCLIPHSTESPSSAFYFRHLEKFGGFFWHLVPFPHWVSGWSILYAKHFLCTGLHCGGPPPDFFKFFQYNFNARLSLIEGFSGCSVVRNMPANAGDMGSILGREDPLEKEMITHSSILAWKPPWTEEPGGLQSIRSSIRD